MKMEQSYLLIITLFSLSEIYLCDEAPYLQPGGDLIDFQLFENTPPNSVVYTLRGYDPEFGVEGLTYTISGDYFSINQKTGVISLKKKVDREIKEFIRVVVTIQDKGNNLIPFSREIVILDENDNAPNFEREPYNFSINETTPVDTVVYSSILVSDKDSFENAKVKLECVPYDLDDKSCEVFMIQTEEYKAGSYFGTITLKKELNYETKSSYKIKIRAKDLGQPRYLSSATEVFIQLIDVQDQPPFFINSPYFSTIKENIASDTKIFDIQVRDGDIGTPQKIFLDIVGDLEHFFVLENQYLNEHSISSATLKTAKNVTIDREMRTVIEAGGIYTFQIRAREILDIKQNYGDETYTNVTVIITDEDDSIPIFNKNFLTIAVPEDVRYDTPLPDLNIIVQDNDSSMNAAFELALNRPGPFSVHPKKAIGKTPVILRVSNPELLDYESPGKNNYKIQINAIQNQSILSNCTINIIVTDSNDNAPTFSKDFYQFSVEENAPAGKSIGFITAFDLDSGSFGQVKYNLKGFGADKFRVNDESGELFINTCMTDTQFWRESCLDYETQEFYFLTYTGTDGGNQRLRYIFRLLM
uniref:Cadherin23like [Nasonia vitripennis] n=1 Tax=Lepeophtheirus salmonis TaxID=72036 RepID=A0A0K2TEW9_LEPSM